mgnify:CR=1 FL=1
MDDGRGRGARGRVEDAVVDVERGARRAAALSFDREPFKKRFRFSHFLRPAYLPQRFFHCLVKTR